MQQAKFWTIWTKEKPAQQILMTPKSNFTILLGTEICFESFDVWKQNNHTKTAQHGVDRHIMPTGKQNNAVDDKNRLKAYFNCTSLVKF